MSARDLQTPAAEAQGDIVALTVVEEPGDEGPPPPSPSYETPSSADSEAVGDSTPLVAAREVTAPTAAVVSNRVRQVSVALAAVAVAIIVAVVAVQVLKVHAGTKDRELRIIPGADGFLKPPPAPGAPPGWFSDWVGSVNDAATNAVAVVLKWPTTTRTSTTRTTSTTTSSTATTTRTTTHTKTSSTTSSSTSRTSTTTTLTRTRTTTSSRTTSTSTRSTTTLSTTSTTRTTTLSTTTTTRLASFFCFAVVRREGYEEELMRRLYLSSASIFGCDEFTLYSNGGVMQIGWITTVDIPLPMVQEGNMSEAGTTTASWLNTQIFMNVWELILGDGRWWKHEWTVKVDPDAVFFPHRLKVRLYPFYLAGIYDGPALFLADCDRSWNGEPPSLKIFGSIEAYTRNAVDMYKRGHKRCEAELQWKGWGEDFYMQMCMEKLGAHAVDGIAWVSDANCYGLSPCTDTSRSVFHAFKEIDEYMSCWKTSVDAEHAEGERALQVVRALQVIP